MGISELDYQIKQANKASNAYAKVGMHEMAKYHFEERCKLQALRSKILNCK